MSEQFEITRIVGRAEIEASRVDAIRQTKLYMLRKLLSKMPEMRGKCLVGFDVRVTDLKDDHQVATGDKEIYITAQKV